MKKLIILSTLLLFGCGTIENQRKAVKHYEKAVKFGFKVVPEYVNVLIWDTTVDGKDTIIQMRTVYAECPTPTFPKSNVEVRQENRTARQNARQDTKQVKSDNKLVKDLEKILANKDETLAKYQKQVDEYTKKQETLQKKYQAMVDKASIKKSWLERYDFYIGLLIPIALFIYLKIYKI